MRYLTAGIVLGYWAGRHASQLRERNLEARLWHAERERDDYLDAWERTAEELRDFREFNRIVADA